MEQTSRHKWNHFSILFRQLKRLANPLEFRLHVQTSCSGKRGLLLDGVFQAGHAEDPDEETILPDLP